MRAKTVKLNIKQRRRIFAMFVLAVFLISIIAYAKYIKDYALRAPIPNNTADYYMDVVWDEEGAEPIKLSEKLNLEEINPGQTQNITFMVRNGNDEKVSDVDLNFSIELIYTENLPLEYTLYEYVGEGQGETTSEGISPYKKINTFNFKDSNLNGSEHNAHDNTGFRKIYKVGANGDRFELEALHNGTISGKKFLLTINWDNSQGNNEDKYSKEVDLAYIVVNASQKL